jgi:MFS transporter, OFA family, oxalate/formate antiporter
VIGRLFAGWVVVGGAFLVLFLAYGTQYAFGVFFSALIEEFGWSRASLAGVFSLYTFVYSCFALVAGRLTDLWGPRRVIAAGGVLLGLGLSGMSLAHALWHPFVLYGLVAALGMSTAYVPCMATVVRWFVRRRGLAVGLASAGGSLGTFALPPVAHALVETLGWRGAYVAFGVVIAIVLNLLARIIPRDPESAGLVPDGEAGSTTSAAPAVSEPSWSVAAATRSGAFWALLAVFSATWIPVFVPLVHLVPHARDLGVEPFWASTMVSALGVGAVAGRLGMGWLSDRIGRRPGLAMAFTLQVTAFVGFAGATTLPALYATSLAFGLAYGSTSACFPAIMGDFFGRAHAGTLVGLVFALAAPASALGPLGAGFIYDHTGSYTLAWWISAGFNLLALGLLALARPPRRRGAATALPVVISSPTS